MDEPKIMRILYVIPGDPDGYSMKFAKQEAYWVGQMPSVEVETFYLASRTSPIILLKELKRLRRLIQTFQPHLIHAQFGTMTAFFCAVSTQVPLVITYRGSDLNPAVGMNQTRWWAGYLLSQLAALRASHLICVSEELAHRLWWGKVSVIPSGVDLTVFQLQSYEAARSQIGWGIDERVVFFYAGASPQHKGIGLVEAAVEYASRTLQNIRLVVAKGDIPFEQMPLFMNAADCLVLASYKEGSPNVTKEAMACNLPVVTVEAGDVVKQLTGVFPTEIVPRDAAALGDALVRVLLERKRSNGREMVKHLDVQCIASQLVQTYQRILKRL
ncbi:MAG: glycosyltransferase family 4 protein [Anaerolineae bacterium]|nr:MAG: glycosyltransferase family 4 protein [Anaerolineae bacterium]